ncbi:MAG: HAD-IA family hydrolase [Methylovulum sp.]|uniref:HAD-IA family hydrolase n=1 Tax=Methylovulum sp. TaxID=1916980 RepID=UPI0026390E60|nr:HAD-IA family hydrolase [Methylovulum sp.]MDD2723538.1 HAD-IA family hydrolase [Methylovulum sp.]MDD5126127.1 HAD-IA family hydrolase [Methylovulum sp.]
MKKAFDLIIFDWDGTLIDSIDWIVHCLQKAGALSDCAIPEQQAAKDVIGLSIDKAMQALFPEADDQKIEKLVRHYREEYFSKQPSPDDLFTGVYDMLVQLKADGYLLAVATGKARAGLDQALAGTGTGDLFITTRCADETASKPDPRMLHEIMAHTQVDKTRVLMVGDSIHDLQMAQNAQIASIAVACGAHSEDFLQQYKPLRCLQLPTQLLDLI